MFFIHIGFIHVYWFIPLDNPNQNVTYYKRNGAFIPVSRSESGHHVLELTVSSENQFTSTSWHHLQEKGEISGMWNSHWQTGQS